MDSKVQLRFVGSPGAPFKGRWATPHEYKTQAERERADRKGGPKNRLALPGEVLSFDPDDFEDMKPEHKACFMTEREWSAFLKRVVMGDLEVVAQYGPLQEKQRRAAAQLLEAAGGMGAAPDEGILGGLNVRDAQELIAAADTSDLPGLLDDEQKGKGRKMVLAAISERMEGE